MAIYGIWLVWGFVIALPLFGMFFAQPLAGLAPSAPLSGHLRCLLLSEGFRGPSSLPGPEPDSVNEPQRCWIRSPRCFPKTPYEVEIVPSLQMGKLRLGVSSTPSRRNSE